jgi:hypothetical protein
MSAKPYYNFSLKVLPMSNMSKLIFYNSSKRGLLSRENFSRLIIYCFTSRSTIFHIYGDVTITGEGLQNVGLCSALRAFQDGGILSCHTCCDMGLQFFRSYPKDRPIKSPLTTHKGMQRTYSTPHPILQRDIRIGTINKTNKQTNMFNTIIYYGKSKTKILDYAVLSKESQGGWRFISPHAILRSYP